MTRVELQEALDRDGVHPDSYSLYGEVRNETYILEENYGRWNVYYSERGLETGKRTFLAETEACEHLLAVLRDDPTTRLPE